MTVDIAITEVTVPEPLRAEFRRLALLASQGDAKAEAQLVALESQIEAAERQQRRRQAADAEAARVAGEASAKSAQLQREAKEKKHRQLVAKRLEGFKAIEDATTELAKVIRETLSVDAEIWSLALQLGWSAETRTARTITNYITTKLGRPGAGLGDMPAPPPALQGDLVNKEKEARAN